MIEARQRHFAGAQSAAVVETPLHQQDVEPGAGEIGAEDQAVMTGADDDAVIGFIERLGQGFLANAARVVAGQVQHCRAAAAPVNGCSRAEI